MNWLPLILLRLVWAQERIAYGARGSDAFEVDPDEVARIVAERDESFAAATRQLLVRLLSDGNFSECNHIRLRALQKDWDRVAIVVSRHREFARLDIGDALKLEHGKLGDIDGDFRRADQRLSDEVFWRLGETLLDHRRAERAEASEPDDSEQIRDAWRAGCVRGRELPQRYARPAVDPLPPWPDNNVVFGTLPRPGKPKP